MERTPPKDDRELEQMTGIRPADHQFTSADTGDIDRMRRQILGPDWFKPRPKKEDK